MAGQVYATGGKNYGTKRQQVASGPDNGYSSAKGNEYRSKDGSEGTPTPQQKGWTRKGGSEKKNTPGKDMGQ